MSNKNIMKKSIIILFMTIFPSILLGQTLSKDSIIINIAEFLNDNDKLTSPNKYEFDNYKNIFFIEDITTKATIDQQGFGIYEFGHYGDDIPSWIMWYDATGYKIYIKFFDTDMLGDILAFCKRNNYDDSKTRRYINQLYISLHHLENIGEAELTHCKCRANAK